MGEAIAECKKAIKLNPKFAPAHVTLGIALREKGDFAGAVTAFRQALTLQEVLVAENPDSMTHAAQLAQLELDIAGMSWRADRYAEAADWAERATKAWTEFYKKWPGTHDTWKKLRWTHWNRAVALNWLDRPAEAIAEMDLAMKYTPEAEKPYQRMMRIRYVAKTGDHRLAAKQIAEELAKPNPAPNYWDAALAYSLCVQAAKGDEKLQAAYGDRAVALLRKVLDTKRDGDDYDYPWRTDADLNPIRHRADFKELLAEYEKKHPLPPQVAPLPREVKRP